MTRMKSDHLLAAAGLALAAASAALPWHVWANGEAYVPPRMAFERLDDRLAGEPADPRLAALPPIGGFDEPFVTGSINPGSIRPAVAGAIRPTASPVANTPTLVFATATHALARWPGRAELALLRPGSALEGDTVARMEMRDGRWTLVTARGRRFAVGR